MDDKRKTAEEKLKGAIKKLDAAEPELARLEQTVGLPPDESLSLDQRWMRIRLSSGN
jgi:hypothetical protein